MTMPKLSELQQKDVWEGWIGAEIRAHYFAEMCERLSRHQRWITWGTLAASSGAAAAVLSGLPAWLRLGLSLGTAGLSLWSLVANNSRAATDCADLNLRWNRLAIDYKALWGDMYSDDAPKRLADLLQRAAELSKVCSALPNHTESMRKWQRYVVEQHGLAVV
jgi:hypothetical protein